ncbi:electron transport complex subunit RsxB [Ottowia caeni]|uniref:electron transport complex subunit RsxB n=1 Tax=Ottowia caeni TaxID=2870339 RepID=UPI001E572E96|nr:electron transport complex subunit RsxB [Ottowia caeni]
MPSVRAAQSRPLAKLLLKALPQTQCTRCGYPDCAGYARAIETGEALINQCPPGGAEGIQRLANITGLDPLPLNPAHGAEAPRSVAWIDEAWCIGCTLCIKACPVDCIIGGNKRMHTVIESDCTGCELCIPACPVDCISLENVTGDRTGWDAWSEQEAESARVRYESTRARRKRQADAHAATLEEKAKEKLAHLPELTKGASGDELDRKRSAIEAALARARAKRQATPK